MVETPKGVVKKNGLHIKETAIQCTYITSKAPSVLQAPARTTDTLRIAAKPPTLQQTVKPTGEHGVAAKHTSHQHTPQAVITN